MEDTIQGSIQNNIETTSALYKEDSCCTSRITNLNSTVKVFVPLQAFNLLLQWYFLNQIFHLDIIHVNFTIGEMCASDFYIELMPGINGAAQTWYATPFGDLIHFPLFYFADILQIKTTWFLDLNYHYYLYNLLLLRHINFASDFLRVPISE